MSDAPKTPTPSQHQIRAELESYLLGDLLGPAGGEGEELTERTVRDRYLMGTLAPSRSAIPVGKSAVDEEVPDELSVRYSDLTCCGWIDLDLIFHNTKQCVYSNIGHHSQVHQATPQASSATRLIDKVR